MITKTTTITCDGCKEIVDTDCQYEHKWILSLRQIDVRLSNRSGITFSMDCPSDIGELHFCDWGCLKKYACKEGCIRDET